MKTTYVPGDVSFSTKPQLAAEMIDAAGVPFRWVAADSGWAFSDASFHNIGTARNDDIGRGRLFPTSVKLQYAFKTPTLRDVARRGPYMHDGSVPTLEAVIDLTIAAALSGQVGRMRYIRLD